MRPSTPNPIETFTKRQRVMMLDGGLATTLEARGWDLRDELWSAKLLVESPSDIRQVHHDFLTAGADCITSASYQASVTGFQRRGIAKTDGIDLLKLSVRLASEARDMVWRQSHNSYRQRPLVAASVGPY